MNQDEYQYELDFLVRDYECDLQGIVNNSIYQNYLEHTRHEFIKSRGLNFAQMHDEGIDAVVSRVEIDYKMPLKSGDDFKVVLNCKPEGNVRILFEQKIFRKADNKLIIQAKVFSVISTNGRPIRPPKNLTDKLYL